MTFSFRTEDPFSYTLSIVRGTLETKQWMYNGNVCIRSNGNQYCTLNNTLNIVGGRNDMIGTDSYGKYNAHSIFLRATDSTNMTLTAR